MSINNRGKFAIGGDGRSTPIPKKAFDVDERIAHDKHLQEVLKDAPSLDEFDEPTVNKDKYQIEIKEEYVEVELNYVSSRHQFIITKVMGSIMEYISGTIQDYTSPIKINSDMIPEVLKFYVEKYSEVLDDIENGNEKLQRGAYLMNFPSILFRLSTVKKFKENTQKFIDGDKTLTNYLTYLKSIRQKILETGRTNRFLKEGEKRKKV